eukprot:TRINITY_DN2784_c0_g1_i1.p1 TRINITY_DN2784_c0_g1~~TRINITY_DN2784_c0_g1_i1.p1  ORF type:complete len:229 (+),score=42.73 TRINITY_DN2784_c0_g1_i1:424-1110(+)
MVSIPIRIQLDWDYDASSKQSPSYFQGHIEKEVSTKYQDDFRNDSSFSSPSSPSSSFPRTLKNESPPSNGVSKKLLKNISSGQFATEALDTHNRYRLAHGVQPLTLCEKLNAYAKEWADHLAATDSFNHRSNGDYGENLFLTYGSGDTDCNGIEPVESWYSEGRSYSYGQSSGSSATGHFTQIVWKGSKRLGMAKSKSPSGKTIVVANYDPPGNFIGNYSSNVLPTNH